MFPPPITPAGYHPAGYYEQLLFGLETNPIAMPQFVHLADDRDVALIRKNGIKAQKIYGRQKKGVFATPVLQNHYQSHQWIRELRRRGIRVISAVQFHVSDDALVAVGRYNEIHLETTAAEAVRIFMEHSTGLGLEVIFSGSIPKDWITRVYTPDQVIGWRYYPESHADGRKPCGCSYCQRGQIKSRKLREAYESKRASPPRTQAEQDMGGNRR